MMIYRYCAGRTGVRPLQVSYIILQLIFNPTVLLVLNAINFQPTCIRLHQLQLVLNSHVLLAPNAIGF